MERSIHELLIILRDNARITKTCFGFKQRIELGLCREIDCLNSEGIEVATFKERVVLKNYLFENKPNVANYYTFYYWKVRLWKPRLKWLNKHIELTKPKQP